MMGVLNVTPDSFSDGGCYNDTDNAISRAMELVAEGADIIDVGGESTRPGADNVSLEEELARVIPVIERIRDLTDVPISIDTRKAPVARQALAAGARIVNDVSGLTADPQMVEVVAASGLPVVIMHARGTPATMQQNPIYRDTLGEISDWLAERIEAALAAGVSKESVIVDPGIGFGKRISDNLLILKELRKLDVLDCPVLVGPSRKRFIGEILDLPERDRLEGTAATVAMAISGGAAIVRVHDVKAMARVARVTDAIMRAKQE